MEAALDIQSPQNHGYKKSIPAEPQNPDTQPNVTLMAWQQLEMSALSTTHGRPLGLSRPQGEAAVLDVSSRGHAKRSEITALCRIERRDTK